nr:discoidin domain-containing protein [Paenibacillus xylanexedens]
MTNVVALGDAIDAVSAVGFVPWGIALIGNEIFVSQYNVTTYKIKVFDTDSYVVKREFIISGVTANQYGSIGTDGKNLLVSNNSECIVTVDKETGAVIKTGTISYRFSLAATFDVDLERDLIVFQQYSGGTVFIVRYSTGVVLNTYKMPTSSTGSGAIIYRSEGRTSAHIVVSQYYNNMIFVSEDINKSTDNLTFSQIYTINNSSKITGLGMKRNQLFIGVYNPSNKIIRLDISSLILNKFLISSEDELLSLKLSTNSTLVPNMTSNILPLGIASSSSTITTSTLPYNAFNVDTSTSWTSSTNNNEWICYEFEKKTIIDKYCLTAQVSTNRAPKDWRFEGSDDGSNWTILDTRTNQINWSLSERREFKFANFKDFKLYRLFIINNNGHPDYIGLGYIELINEKDTLVKLDSFEEQDYILHGVNKGSVIDLNKKNNEIMSKNKISTSLGSGKVFNQKIDPIKIPIKKVSIT